MKILFLIFLILKISSALHAQTILNSSFEISEDMSKSIPQFWNFTIAQANGAMTHRLSDKMRAYLDSSAFHSGKYSLKMSVSDTNNFVFGCTQRCDITISAPVRINITAWLKTNECKQGAGLNCTQYNKKGEKIDYTSSRQQDALLMNTNTWTKTELIVLLRPEVKSIDLWTSLYGAGTVWFDEVKVEPFSGGTLKTAQIVSAYLDTLIKDVKESSLWKDSLNWKMMSHNLTTLAVGMQTYREAQLLTRYLINELHLLGDNHSQFMPPTEVKKFGTEDIQGKGRKVQTKYLGQGVGYISVPGFASMKDSLRVAFATEAHEAIKRIDTKNIICSWIVDLRDDNGGSATPMIAALGPVLGDGISSIEISDNSDTSYITGYRNGTTYEVVNGKSETDGAVKVSAYYTLKNKNSPVAVLIGAGCGSSGECAVAAFIGRYNTKLFGQPTAGFTKGNQSFTLPDSSMIFISAGILTDRNGKKYRERIFPDIQVEETLTDNTDVTLDKAKEWLVSFGNCK